MAVASDRMAAVWQRAPAACRRAMKGHAMSTMSSRQAATARTRWIVDSDASTVEFAVKTCWGLTTVRGRFQRFGGTYEVAPDGMSIDLTIDGASVDTGNRK